MNVLVTGADGQLGSEIQVLSKTSEWNFYFTDVGDLDITGKNAVGRYFDDHSVDICVNCAAYTQVDKAESEPDLARSINAIAVRNLAVACNVHHVTLIHISTDFVFDGKNYLPYKESHPTAPVSVYGKTKLAGEIAAATICENWMIIRTSWLYSVHKKNFVHTMLRVGQEKKEVRVVFDQVGTPTYAEDLAGAIYKIINAIVDKPDRIAEWKGLYHYSNEGVASWYDFAYEIFGIAGLKTDLIPVRSEEYPTPAIRPAYSVLDKEKIKRTFGLTIPHWKFSLENCMKKLGTD